MRTNVAKINNIIEAKFVDKELQEKERQGEFSDNHIIKDNDNVSFTYSPKNQQASEVSAKTVHEEPKSPSKNNMVTDDGAATIESEANLETPSGSSKSKKNGNKDGENME